MTRFWCSLTIVAALGAVSPLAAEELILQASARRVFVSADKVNGTTFGVNRWVDGVSTLGAWEGYNEVTVRGNKLEGFVIMDFGDGNTVRANYLDPLFLKVSPQVGENGGIIGPCVFDSGTGIFEGASGVGIITVEFPPPEGGDLIGHIDGLIDLPGD